MAEPEFDLGLYLARIGYGGPTEVTHATLAGLLAAHMDAIPFENIDVLLGRPIRLDLPSLQRKIVAQRRGGYCFEQTTLLLAALRALGFDATPRTARVVLVLTPEEAPRGHMHLVVRLPEGVFVADPGLGGVGCRAPIPLDGSSVRDGDERYRFETGERQRVLLVEAPDRTYPAWIAGFDDDHWIDFEVANHWTATHPASPFVNRLMIRAMTPGGRVTLMNRSATIHTDRRAERFELRDLRALRGFVRTYCGFDCPDLERLHIPTAADWR